MLYRGEYSTYWDNQKWPHYINVHVSDVTSIITFPFRDKAHEAHNLVCYRQSLICSKCFCKKNEGYSVGCHRYITVDIITER